MKVYCIKCGEEFEPVPTVERVSYDPHSGELVVEFEDVIIRHTH